MSLLTLKFSYCICNALFPFDLLQKFKNENHINLQLKNIVTKYNL